MSLPEMAAREAPPVTMPPAQQQAVVSNTPAPGRPPTTTQASPPATPAPPQEPPAHPPRQSPHQPDHSGRQADLPTEYTPALLVEAEKKFKQYVHGRLGEHVYRVLQEIRTDAEALARSQKMSPKQTLGQLLGEVGAWRHLPSADGATDTVLDQETEAALMAVPDLMKAVESCIVTGAMVLSGAKGSGNEPVSVRIPSARDFMDRVFVRVAKSYTDRHGPSRLKHHLSGGKHKLLSEVRAAVDEFLTPYDTVWNANDEQAVVDVPVMPQEEPVAGVAGQNVRTITLDGAGNAPGNAQTAPGGGGSDDIDKDGSGSESGSAAGSDDADDQDQDDDDAHESDGTPDKPQPKPRQLDDDGF